MTTLAMPLLLLALGACTWFTDFKEQPKIDPWDTPDTNTAPRGNPQGSVPVYGSVAPEFLYPRTFQGLTQLATIKNPVPATQESVDRGRKAFQINCAACHGPAGAAGQSAPMFKFGIYAPTLAAGSNAATNLSDGYIFGIIRNGRGLMPTYNRIEEMTRWDIVNYVRTLEGKTGFVADTSHGRPGETGEYLVGATNTAPTRPAPYYAPIGAQAGAREGFTGAPAALPRTGPAVTPTTRDTIKPPAAEGAAQRPPIPEAQQ